MLQKRLRISGALLGVFLFTGCWTLVQALEIETSAPQGGLLIGSVAKGSTVSVNGQSVRVSPEGVFLAGFGRDDQQELNVVETTSTGELIKAVVVPVVREYKIQRIDGLPPSKVTPRSEETWERIKAEVALVKQARKRDDARTDFLDGFEWPAHGRITGVYGSQRILNGKPRRPHYGVDIAAPAGSLVLAPAGGLITVAHKDMFFSGGTILLDHGHGLSSAFLHMQNLAVEVGQRVEKGDVLGEVGSTGRSTGAHLDWRMNLFDKRLDVGLLVPPMESKAASQ